MNQGKLYGVGVGPGDPELMTLKACRLIREHRCIAVPGRNPRESAAYRTALKAVPELAGKELIAVPMPMSRDLKEVRRQHRESAELLASYLNKGISVVFLTLGDVTVYSTFLYLGEILAEDGFETELVSGVPSFCAAAAVLGVPLALGDEPLHILPALNGVGEQLALPGTCVLMKAGGSMERVKEEIRKSGRWAAAVENCGTDRERVYRSTEEIPDDAGYFTLVITGRSQT